jgi:hypothetical protein
LEGGSSPFAFDSGLPLYYDVGSPFPSGWGCLPPAALPLPCDTATTVPTITCHADLHHLSLSRLNHWLPRGQAHPEVVQGTAEFPHQITVPLLPQAEPVLHDAAALDTPVDVLDAQPPLVERLVRPLLLPRERLAAAFHGMVI